MKVPRSAHPPGYPEPVTHPLRRQGARERLEARRHWMTRAMFALFAPGGRIGLVIMGGISASVFGVAWLRMVRGDWRRVGGDLLACVLVGVTWFCLGVMFYKYRRIERMAEVRCPECGYDCSFSAGRCPECGRVVNEG